MKKNWVALSTGVALFSMFFGSGNLVFPIEVGKESDGHYLLAALGIILSGVLVPFLGVIGMMLYKGDIKSFFACFGKKGIFLFSFLSLALMGPFGVLARCLTVAHGALQLLFPDLSLPIASAIMCVIIYLLAINKNKIVSALGVVLTPLLIGAIVLIAYFGLTSRPMVEPVNLELFAAWKNGYFQGYQTMDLLAAFFFSHFVIGHLYEKVGSQIQENALFKIFLNAAFIGASLLAAVYFALVMLGWAYAPSLAGVPPKEMLGVIALESLGAMAAPCVCIAIVLACLTTAIVLAYLFAEFLRTEVTQSKINMHVALIVTLFAGFMVSTLDFAGIAKFLGPILEAVYPALIILTTVNIVNKFIGIKATHWPFTATIALKMCFF